MAEAYDDFIGCCVQSLNDGYADYCFKKLNLGCIYQRLRKEGKTSALVIYVNDDGFKYWHLLPIRIYKHITDDKGVHREVEVRYLMLSTKNLPDKYKYVYKDSESDKEFVLKDYGKELDTDLLKSLIVYTNELNL